MYKYTCTIGLGIRGRSRYFGMTQSTIVKVFDSIIDKLFHFRSNV